MLIVLRFTYMSCIISHDDSCSVPSVTKCFAYDQTRVCMYDESCLLSDLTIWRDIIRNAVNASESDSVIFVGSGVTGAIHKLIHALDFREPPVSTQFTALLYHLYWFLKREDIQPTPMQRCCVEFISLMLDSCEFPFMQCALTFTSTVCFLARKMLVISDFHPVSSVGKAPLYQTRGCKFKPWPYILRQYIYFL